MRNAYRSLREFWTHMQVDLAGVVRFASHNKRNPALRRQTTDVHTLGYLTLLVWGLEQIDRYIPGLKSGLVLKSATLHDSSEGTPEIGDIEHPLKTDEGDVKEYLAFYHRIEHFTPIARQGMLEAFLLQYADVRGPEGFPDEAAEIIRMHQRLHPFEARFLSAMERFDYLFPGLEAYQVHGDVYLLLSVLRRHTPHLQRYAETIPGFGKEIWTPDLDRQAQAFMIEHAALPPEE